MPDGWINISAGAAVVLGFMTIALLDTTIPQNFGNLSAISWWVVVALAGIVVLKVLSSVDDL